MPDGGHPLHLVLRPKGHPDLVVHARGRELRVFSGDEWEIHADDLFPWPPETEKGTPLLALNEREVRVLVDHLTYWLHAGGRGYTDPDVDADFIT